MVTRGVPSSVALVLVLLFVSSVAAEEPVCVDRDAALALAERALAENRPNEVAQAYEALRILHEASREDLPVRRALGRVLVYRAERGTDETVCGLLLARAEAHLAAVTADAAHANDEDAWIDLARGRHLGGDSDRALQALDAYLGAKPSRAGPALAWKGKILYEQARASHAAQGGGFPLSANVHRLYARSQGVCQAGVRVDPGSFDAWIHLAWSSQVLGERSAALEAYERAYLLDPESPHPLRGVSALLAHEPEKLAEVLERFKQKDPAHRRIRLREGYDLVKEGRYDEGVGFFEVYLEEFPDDPEALTLLGRSHAGLGNEEEALACYERALALGATNVLAVDTVERPLRETALARARTSVQEARALIADYRRLFDLAPDNPYIRNNLAFALREGWNAHKDEEGWREILLQSARCYEEGARIIGPWQEEKRESLPWGTRYGYAQMVCDTGILFFSFEAIRDLDRAERYLLTSLRYVDYGYLDSWTYLRRLYEEQGRWTDLQGLAEKCAEGLCSEAGDPLEKHRDQARQAAIEASERARQK